MVQENGVYHTVSAQQMLTVVIIKGRNKYKGGKARSLEVFGGVGVKRGRKIGGGGGAVEGQGERRRTGRTKRRRRVRGHATSTAPQAQPAMRAWPRLLPHVVIKTIHAFPLHPAATSGRCGPGCQREQLSPDVPSCKMRTQRRWEGHRSLGGMARGTVLSGGNHTTAVTCPGLSSSHK